MPYAVLLRDADGARPYAAALAPLGLEVVAMPVTRSEPPSDPGALVRALERTPAVIVVASARAAAALVGASARAAAAAGGHAPVRPRALDGAGRIDAELWAVGPATARVLSAAGLTARVPDAANASALARAIIAARDLRGVRVLVPRAEGGREDGIELLRAAGAIVDDVVAYRTVPTPRDDPSLARGLAVLPDAAWCVAFAPSQVHALAALVPIGGLRFAAIGDTTAAALRELGVVPVVAASPTPEGLASALGE